MDEQSHTPQDPKLLGRKDWDTHNKKAEKAARAYQDFMATDGAAAKRPKKSGKRWIVIMAVVIVLAMAGGLLYKFVLSGKDSDDKAAAPTEQTQQTSESASIASTETKDFSSSDLGLSFKYPDDWTLDETTVGKVTVTSPKVSLLTAGDIKTSGKIVMTIRAKGQALAEFTKGDAIATKQSELLTYKTPTQNQRANTYLTFAAYAGATSGIDGLYITGDYGYQKGQAVLQTEVAAIDPVINITFTQCSDATCSKTTPITISTSSWDDTSFSTPLKTMLESITVQ